MLKSHFIQNTDLLCVFICIFSTLALWSRWKGTLPMLGCMCVCVITKKVWLWAQKYSFFFFFFLKRACFHFLRTAYLKNHILHFLLHLADKYICTYAWFTYMHTYSESTQERQLWNYLTGLATINSGCICNSPPYYVTTRWPPQQTSLEISLCDSDLFVTA